MEKNKRLIQVTVQLSLVMILLLLGTTLAQAAPGVTLTVNSAADDAQAHDRNPGDGVCKDNTESGRCTLRTALEEANAHAGHDTIHFSSSMNILVDVVNEGELPIITETTFIDASSVWNTSNDTPGIKISPLGITPNDSCGLCIDSDHGQYYGLYITGWVTGDGVRIMDSENIIGGPIQGQRNVLSGNLNGLHIMETKAKGNRVEGNYIGLAPNGTTLEPNSKHGIYINYYSTKNVIGGPAAGQGNFISGNGKSGIFMGGAHETVILGNSIGITTQSASAGNGEYGIFSMNTDSVQIGVDTSNSTVAGNFIANNFDSGILYYHSHGMIIQANHIAENGSLAGSPGIACASSMYSLILENTIHANAGAGVEIDTQTNRMSQNSITLNGGKGIEFVTTGVGFGTPPPNTPSPMITTATQSVIGGTTCAFCEIEVFTGYDDEGELYMVSTFADTYGNWSIAVSGVPYSLVTATTLDIINPYGHTSEFSAPAVVQP